MKSAVAGGVLLLDSLRAVSGRSQSDVRGSLSGSQVDASTDLNVELNDFGNARGRVRAHVAAAGLLDALQINSVLTGEDLLVSDTAIHRPMAEVSVNLGSGEMRIHALSVGILGGRLTASGQLCLGTETGRSGLKASLNGVKILQERTTVDAAASWPGLNWRFAKVSGVARTRMDQVKFNLIGRPDSLRGASLDATLSGGASVQGDIGFAATGHTLTGAVRGNVDSVARFGRRWNLPNLDGAALWSATLGGTIDHPAASLQLEVNGLSAGAWSGAGLQVRADYRAGRIGVQSARLTWQGQQIEASGEIGGTSADAPLKLEGTVEGREFAGVEGAVSGKFRAAGTVACPVAEVTLRAPMLTAYGQHFVRAGLDASWREGGLTLTRLTAEQDHESGPPGRIDATGGLDTATGRYTVKAAATDIRPVDVVLPGNQLLSGSFRIEAQGAGTLSDPAFSARLYGSGVNAGDFAIGDVHGRVDATGHQATAAVTAPGLEAHAESSIRMAKHGRSKPL